MNNNLNKIIQMNINHFENVPDEIIEDIMYYLDLKSLLSLCITSKQFKNIFDLYKERKVLTLNNTTKFLMLNIKCVLLKNSFEIDSRKKSYDYISIGEKDVMYQKIHYKKNKTPVPPSLFKNGRYRKILGRNIYDCFIQKIHLQYKYFNLYIFQLIKNWKMKRFYRTYGDNSILNTNILVSELIALILELNYNHLEDFTCNTLY